MVMMVEVMMGMLNQMNDDIDETWRDFPSDEYVVHTVVASSTSTYTAMAKPCNTCGGGGGWAWCVVGVEFS
jgi:hypothetical protein